MSWIADLLTVHFVIFTLTLARVGGFVVTAPLYSFASIPVNVRALLAICLAMIIAPTQAPLGDAPATFVAWGIAAAAEAMIGLALGLGTAILLNGAQLGGQLMTQVGGLSLSEVFDPASESGVPVLSQFVGLLAMAVYLLIGGHRWLLVGLLDTFSVLPLASSPLPDSVAEVLLTLVSQSFSLGIRVAAPLVIALLLTTLVMGIVSRTLPQLNILSVGFGLNTLVAFATLAVSVGTVGWILEEQLQPTVTMVVQALAPAAPPARGFR